MVFHGSRLVFHGFSWFFMVLGWFFMVFHGFRLVFHGFSPKCTRPNCILARRSSLGPPPGGIGIGPSILKYMNSIYKFYIENVHKKGGRGSWLTKCD